MTCFLHEGTGYDIKYLWIDNNAVMLCVQIRETYTCKTFPQTINLRLYLHYDKVGIHYKETI